ncbi:hypothetical protein FALBO_1832 [Fusarium albosuccineum]|uniref:Myb transcription factor n=1 Tax=Fusarium albosuccineum TaxID=1237068 RepID=A0A8H4LM40_9HYPO|nr:hypothetical protein FALBO_1832 [Fusarium albosuccineum]
MSSNGTGNSKWPDFRLASTLWSLMGSQSNGPDKQTATDRVENHDHDRAQHQEKHPDDERDGELQQSHTADHAMMDPEGQPIDGLSGFDNFEEHTPADTEDGAQDQDFGALEMFDSNAAQAPYSSQLNDASLDTSRVPEAVMSEEVTSSQRKSKREKKDRKKSTPTDSASPQPPADVESSRKPRKSKRKSAMPVEIPDSLAENNAAEVDQAQLPDISVVDLNDEAAVPATQPKRKRKSSHSSDGKQRKKRRSHDHEIEAESQEVVQGTQEDREPAATGDAQAASFLRTRNSSRAAAIYDDIAEDAPKSPSDARLQLRDARSREGSAPANDNHDKMDIDAPVTQEIHGNAADRELGTDAFAVNGSSGSVTAHDIAHVAREAWNEHLNGQTHPESQETFNQPEEIEIPTSAQRPQTHDVYDVPGSPIETPNPPSANTKRTRSVKAKKAKPTYFEKSPSPEVDQDGLAALPSPSAATPKPRRRAKKASSRRKSEANRALMAQSTQDGADDDEQGDDLQGRRNRMAGYTQGRFSDEELGRIAQAVEAYRVEHDMLQHQLNEMLHAPGGTTAGDEHAALWARIFATCPDRHRQKIINITRKKFHNFVARGTWTQEQDIELRDLIEVHGTKWSKIAAIINRHPEDLRDRYRNYIVCGDSQRKDAWDETEEGNLTQYVMEAMGAIDELRVIQPTRELLKKPYEELIDWQNISERMERTRSRLQCITKWKAMNIKTHGRDKLVSHQPDAPISFRLEKARRQIAAMPDEERYRLVLAIHGSSAQAESKIPWQKLVDKQFRNSWHRPTQMLLWRRLKHMVPDWEQKSVRDCAQYLVDVYSQAGELPNVEDALFNDAQEMEFLGTIPATHIPNGSSQHNTYSNISAEYVAESDVGGEGQQQMDVYGIPDENINPDLPLEPMEHLESSVPVASMEPDAPVEPEAPVETAEVVDPALGMNLDEPVEPGLPQPDFTQPSEPEAEPESFVRKPTGQAEFVEPAPPKATRTAKRTGMGRAKAPKAPRKSTARSTPAKSTPARRSSRRAAAASQDPIEDDEVAQPVAAREENSDIDEAQLRRKKTPSKFRPINAVDEAAAAADDSDSVMDDMEDLPARITA